MGAYLGKGRDAPGKIFRDDPRLQRTKVDMHLRCRLCHILDQVDQAVIPVFKIHAVGADMDAGKDHFFAAGCFKSFYFR